MLLFPLPIQINDHLQVFLTYCMPETIEFEDGGTIDDSGEVEDSRRIIAMTFNGHRLQLTHWD